MEFGFSIYSGNTILYWPSSHHMPEWAENMIDGVLFLSCCFGQYENVIEIIPDA